MNGLAHLSRFFATHPLTRDNPVGAWTRFAAWQIRSRIRDEVVVPWIGGQRLAVRRGMVGATGNIYVGLHEFHDMMLPLHFLREGDLFLDVGANVGSYTVLASGVCRATTWCFEPDPVTAGYLRRNIALNDLAGRTVVHELALGPKDGEVKFTVGRDTVNHVTTDASVPVRSVPQKRLDDVVGAREPIMIKMDVEGYEDSVLAGAQAVLAKPGLKVIELETVDPGIRRMLAGHGFEECGYDPFTRTLADRSNGPGSSNTAFVRDADDVRTRLSQARPVAVLGRSI